MTEKSERFGIHINSSRKATKFHKETITLSKSKNIQLGIKLLHHRREEMFIQKPTLHERKKKSIQIKNTSSHENLNLDFLQSQNSGRWICHEPSTKVHVMLSPLFGKKFLTNIALEALPCWWWLLWRICVKTQASCFSFKNSFFPASQNYIEASSKEKKSVLLSGSIEL